MEMFVHVCLCVCMCVYAYFKMLYKQKEFRWIYKITTIYDSLKGKFFLRENF